MPPSDPARGLSATAGQRPAASATVTTRNFAFSHGNNLLASQKTAHVAPSAFAGRSSDVRNSHRVSIVTTMPMVSQAALA
jgi:hypothetical protein